MTDPIDTDDLEETREHDPSEQVEHDLDELLAKAAERDEYLELAQRTQADFENFRKRAQRETELAVDRGVAKLARELLPALDSLERALQAGEGDTESDQHSLAEGIRLVHADLTSALARLGIQAFSPEGEQFDPEWHEAMAQHADSDRPSGTIIEVYQRGYRSGSELLRPAKVVVAK